MKDKGTDEEVTDEEWKTCAKITDEDGMKDTDKNHDFKIFDTDKVKIKKTTHFTMNVLKRNIRTKFFCNIVYLCSYVY